MKASNKYYNEQQIIPKTDKNGNIIGQIEKWEAHKKGILHKGFSIVLVYKGKYILQHRRHPAFDGFYDLSTSSHQLWVDGGFQSIEDAAIEALKREWVNIVLIDKPKILGTVYYNAKDPKSIYTEHEVCDILEVSVRELPVQNLEFAYGHILVTNAELKYKSGKIYKNLSPWSKKSIEEDLFD
jgi:isopentenyldiphosphate isomerase